VLVPTPGFAGAKKERERLSRGKRGKKRHVGAMAYGGVSEGRRRTNHQPLVVGKMEMGMRGGSRFAGGKYGGSGGMGMMVMVFMVKEVRRWAKRWDCG